MPFRIALLFEYTTLNGGERSMLAALDWLRTHDDRFDFVAIAPNEGRLAEALRQREIPIVDWQLSPDGSQRLSKEDATRKLLEVVTDLRPELIHANSLAMGRLSGYLSAQTGMTTTSHIRDIIKVSRAVVDDLNSNRGLVAVSTATREFHLAQGLDSNRVIAIHNGIDLEQFQPRPQAGKLEQELCPEFCSTSTTGKSSVGQNRPQWIATIGQIGLRKGLDQLAQAAPIIVRQVPHAHFLLIGERNSQKQESIDLEQAIRSQFESFGLADRLHLLGQRSDVSTILNEIDLLIHPANQEPLGRVLIEASASGVPIVATDVGGTTEIIEPGRTGLLVPRGEPEQLAKAAIRLLTDTQLSSSFRVEARKHAERHFPISLAATRLADFWLDVLQNSSR